MKENMRDKKNYFCNKTFNQNKELMLIRNTSPKYAKSGFCFGCDWCQCKIFKSEHCLTTQIIV